MVNKISKNIDKVLDDLNINHPQHYNIGKFETIDIIKDVLDFSEFKGFLLGNRFM